MKRLFIGIALGLLIAAPVQAQSTVFEDAITVGDAYYKLGIYRKAEKRYIEALVEARNAGNQDQELLALRKLGDAYYMAGNFEDSEQIFRKALEVCEQLSGAEALPVVDELNNLVKSLRRQNKWSDAGPHIRRVITLRTKLLANNDRLISNSWLDLAVNLQREGRLDDSDMAFGKALVSRENALGAEHRSLTIILDQYAELLRQLNRTAEADSLELRSKTIKDKLED